MTSTGRAAGFVLDADEVAQDRWRAVCGRLEGVGLTPPDEIPGSGYVGHAGAYQARVGVWLMPDNRRSGALEEFLQDLVDSRDSVFPIAEESTDLAKGRGAPFPDSQRRKAVLHAWLAWQGTPPACRTARQYAPGTSATTVPRPWPSSSGSRASSSHRARVHNEALVAATNKLELPG